MQNMSDEEKIEKGFIETSTMPFPTGGDYTKAHFLDKFGQYIHKDSAAIVMLEVFMNDGTKINEVWYTSDKAAITEEDFADAKRDPEGPPSKKRSEEHTSELQSPEAI